MNKLLSVNDIKLLHLEPSSRCNAACPQCVRNYSGGKTIETLPMMELSISDYDRIFTPSVSKSVNHTMFCGVFGDPAISTCSIEAINLIKKRSNTSIGFYTNGGIRDKDFWDSLGALLSSPGDYVSFGIDGLENTNHIYRRNVKWNNLIENIETFINAGGNAQWDYLIFKHNEHQIEEAKKLAKCLGFKRFRLRKTSRFGNEDRQIVYKQNGDFDYNIEPPTNKEYKNTQKIPIKDLNKYFKTVKIECKSQRLGEIFIGADGSIWPCSYLYSAVYGDRSSKFYSEIMKLYEYYGNNFNHIQKITIDELLNHPWLNNDLVTSFYNKDRLLKCGKTCGIDYDPIHSQSQRIEL